MKVRDNKKYFVLCYMAGFFAGILYANLAAGDYIANIGILDDYFLEQYIHMDIETVGFFWYVLYVRFLPVLFLLALGCTRLRKAAAFACILWTGFSCGMILVAAVMKLGVKGIILCLISLLPQILCYVAGYLIMLWIMTSYPVVKWNLTKAACFLLFMGLGILLECYVNPVIMKLFLKTL